MATTSETGSSLADRLMARSARNSRIGSRKGIFERFGLQSPYEGGTVSDPGAPSGSAGRAGLFSFLSSKAYFDELRGLSELRGKLLYRISGMRQKIRVGEAIRTSVATESARAAMLDRYDPTFIDWSTQLDLEELGIEEPADAVAVAAARHMPKRRRPSAAERALRARITEASDTLQQLQSLARVSVGAAQKSVAERRAQSISALPGRRQPAAARQLTRKLRGTQAAAARGTSLNARATEAGSVGTRPLAVATARDSFFAPKGLRRVTEDSPIVMTLEQPESPAPEAEPEPTVQRASRRPAIRPRAHRRVPVAPVAREARNQADAGRAGPPVENRTERRADPLALSRPTERIARSMRLEQATPLTDTRRGLEAAYRSTPEADQASQSLERRIAVRAEAGLPDASGRVLNTTGYVAADRDVGRRLTQTAEGRITAAPRTASLVDSVPEMAPIQHEESGVDAAVEAPEDAPQAQSSRPVTREPRRARVHRTPTSSTRASDPVRTPSTRTEPTAAVRTPTATVRPGARARRASPVVRRALPPMARAIHRSEPVAAEPASRVAISRTPIDSRAFSAGVDRREVGLSRQLAAAVAREATQRHASTRPQQAAAAAPGFVMATPQGALSTDADENDEAGPEAAAQGRAPRSSRPPTQRLADQASESATPETAETPERTSDRLTSRADAPPVSLRTVDSDSADASEMRVAIPRREAPASDATESAQRAIASSGPSRRSRALPTVRAASRALAQERLGARGRLLSPSSTAHVDVTDARRALDAAPLARGIASRPVSARLDATPLVYAQPQLENAAAEDDAGEGAEAPRVPSRRPASRRAAGRPSRRSTRAAPTAAEPSIPSTRLGPVARATERSSAERVGLTGELLAPRVVAQFEEPGIPATAPDAPASLRSSHRLERADAAPARSVGLERDGRVMRSAERVEALPLTLAAPEPTEASDSADSTVSEGVVATPRTGLASRASDRVERSRSARRSVLPAPTPEVVRARAASQDQVRTGASQPVRTESGRVVPSRAVRTDSTPVERSIAWRTPRSYHARTVALRTPSGSTEASAAFRTESSATARSTAFRTATRREARLADEAPALTPLADHDGPVSVEEIDPEGATVRASRRMDVRRNAVSDSAVTHLSHAAPEPFAGASEDPLDGATPVSRSIEREDRASQSRRAVGRSAVRQDAGSVVPHPVGSDATDRAVTRMLGGPEQVYAASEDVVLDRDVAMPGDSLRTRSTSGAESRVAERARDRVQPETRASRPTSHLADGMTLAAPVDSPPEEAPESIAGGRRAVAPRPGAPSRSRLQQAMRAATTAAASRATETVLTLPSPQRQLEPQAEPGSGTRTARTDAARPRYQVRLSVDETGRVLRASAIDATTGTQMTLPESAVEAQVRRVAGPTMTPALPEPQAAPGAAEWAETRARRANETVSRRRGAERRARTMQDAGGTYVQRPSTDAVGIDVAGAPFIPGRTADAYAPADLRFAGLDDTLDVLAGPDDTRLGARLDARAGAPGTPGARRPLLRRRTWQRRSAAAELGTIAPVLADAEYSDAPDVPSDSPSWARRAVTGTSAAQRDSQDSQTRTSSPTSSRADDWSPNSLMGALVRAERAEDLVQVILERGREVASLREALPNEAVRMVETIAGLDPDDVAVLRSRSRIIRPGQLPGAAGTSRTRASRSRKGSPDLHQLSAAKDGVGANKITKLADKLMNLIHLAEHARTEARSSVRMAEDSNEARAEGGARVPGMSVEDGDMNLDALYKSVLDSTMEYFEELDSRREDPDGRNKWW